MKKLLLGLLCFSLGGVAWAQSPAPAPTRVLPYTSSVSVLPQTPSYSGIQPVSGYRIFNSGFACGSGDCCAATKTICVAEPAKKINVKVNYSSECGKICYRAPAGLFASHTCDAGCSGGNCSHSFNTKVLIKKLCITECETTKCVPVTVPACASGHGMLHGTAPVGPAVETIPVAPMKK